LGSSEAGRNVRLERIELRNYRSFEQFDLEIAGNSLLLVGANAVGKSTLLAAIEIALRGGRVARSDFRDLLLPLEVIATLGGISPSEQGSFADVMDFSVSPPVLRIGLRAVWDPDELELDIVHGYPEKTWSRTSRATRESISLLSLPGWRDAARLTRIVGRDSLLDRLISELELQDDLEEAVASVTVAAQQLADAEPLKVLLAGLTARLGGFLAEVEPNAFSLGLHLTEPRDVLRQMELLLRYAGQPTPAGGQSGGLSQASVFALALALIGHQPGTIVLVDDPEAALGPQAQRALVGELQQTGSQTLIATHSAAVLDRRDPREVVRLRRDDRGCTQASRAGGLSEKDAARLLRYSTSLTGEAYFARVVILVEGFSDFLALQRLAALAGRNLDGEAVALIALEGESLFKHYLDLFGPGGLELDLRGLCDLDAESSWISRLAATGYPVSDRGSLTTNGFFVCDPDLEAELVDALGAVQVEQVLDEDGAHASFEAFAAENAGVAVEELQRRFIKKDKIRWAPLLATRLTAQSIPNPIAELLRSM
jgi:energy-coupling factor transporter ATP-binding protein EcfA2